MSAATSLITVLTLLVPSVINQISAVSSWSQELASTQAPGQIQPHPAQNHAYPGNSTPASLSTGPITQDPVFDDLPEPWNGQDSFIGGRKWFSRPAQDIQASQERQSDISSHNMSMRLFDLLHPPATYFSFADHLAPLQSRPHMQMKNPHLTPRSSESNSVWTNSEDPSDFGSNLHRVVSRQLTEFLPNPKSNKPPHPFERRFSQRNTPFNPITQGKNPPWLRAIASRIGRSPSSNNDANLEDSGLSSRASKVTFDDQTGQQDMESPSTSGSSKRDLSSSVNYHSLPLIYESVAQASEGRNSKSPLLVDEESMGDSIAAQSRYSAYGHQHPLIQPHIYAAFPGPYGLSYKNSPASSRKGVEKSILVGVGSALISFLILSNIFLSLPLLAITLMHLIGGTNLLPPFGNNNQTPNGNTNGQPTTNGRKKREIDHDLLNERVYQAIDRFTTKLKIY